MSAGVASDRTASRDRPEAATTPATGPRNPSGESAATRASDRRNAADSRGSPASSFDAVVIGAGVIGAATAFELGRRGRRVLCVDKLPAAGFGSTVNSCAIVRFTYST
ncbi:MAG: FAD-dependent oxidoreductase, partial [Acidimicrobiaceae bacterium]|nr:FAD-dependent oxidoreductase [Acidimicrobiaceae bacterium]